VSPIPAKHIKTRAGYGDWLGYERVAAQLRKYRPFEEARQFARSRARLTQIMNLLNLAPDIQESILHLPRVERGRDPVAERDLRPVAAVVDWGKQRQMWRDLSSF
jgi:hypothetical protein